MVVARLGNDCLGCVIGCLRADWWRGGRRPGHFFGGDFAQICRLVGKLQRALPVADQHGLGFESGQCHLPSSVDLHAAGRASFVKDWKDGVFNQSEVCRLTVRIFDQPGHGVRCRGLRFGCRLGSRLRGRHRNGGGCCWRGRWLDQIAEPLEGVIRQIADCFARRAPASPLVESPGRAANQSEEGEGKEKPAHPSPTVPCLQLEVGLCFGGWHGGNGNRCCALGWKRRHDKTTTAQRAFHLVFRPRGVRVEFLVAVGAVDTHGAGFYGRI